MLSLGFHWRNGWYFNRLEDGSIRVSHADNYDAGFNNIEFTIPAAEWASIVCSVSEGGETLDRWNQAQDFHGRVEEPLFGMMAMTAPTGKIFKLKSPHTLLQPEREAMDEAFWNSVTTLDEGYGIEPTTDPTGKVDITIRYTQDEGQ